MTDETPKNPPYGPYEIDDQESKKQPRETLLDVSGIQLYGRIIDSIKLDFNNEAPDNNDLLFRQLNKVDPHFARIYCYVCEGVIYTPPRTFVMLVHGEGKPSGSEFNKAVTDLLLPQPIRYWTYDKEDHSLRMELFTGTLNDLLLNQASGYGAGQMNAGGQMNAAGQMNAGGQMNAAGQMNVACRNNNR